MADYPSSLMQQIFGAVPPSVELDQNSKNHEELINVRLQRKIDGKLTLKPREYQQQLFLHTLNNDTIIFLGTGLGKTLVVAMYLQSPQLDKEIQSGRKAVFLAPTQDLTKQQAEYLSNKVPYRCRVYCGRTSQLGIHIDHWDRATWQNELKQIDLMFMTPQILSSAISSNLLDWESLSVVIFDECHHAAKPKKGKQGHPYYQLLKSFNGYYPSRPNLPRPRKIGLTASLINSQPKNAQSISDQVSSMESLMGAKCVTDHRVMDKFPRMVSHKYINHDFSEDDPIIYLLNNFSRRLKEVIDSKKPDVPDSEKRQMLSFLNRLRLASSGFSIKPHSFNKVLNQLASIRHRSGLWTFANICHELIKALEKHGQNRCVQEEIRPIYEDFAAIFKLILMAITEFLRPQDLTPADSSTKVLLDYASPKSLALLDVLLNEYKLVRDSSSNKDAKSTFSCIIFVKSRVEVFALKGWIQNVSKHLPIYDFIKCDYAIGISATMASKWACITKRKARDQGKMLDDFRKGSLNVIVTTSVLEEGIDLPRCSTVIRYDKADNFRVYVQSRGRARQQVSSYVSLCPDDKEKEYKDTLNKFNDFEFRIKEVLQGNRIGLEAEPRPAAALPPSPLDEPDVFIVDEGRLRITGSSARILLNMYCQRLVKSRPYNSGMQVECHRPTRTTYQSTIFLPTGCPIREGITGNEKNDIKLAANSAVVAAVRKLFEAKELNEHGIPHRTLQHVEQVLIEKNLLPEMGPLDERLEGKIIKDSDRILHEFSSKVTTVGSHGLLCNTNSRTYKLIRVQFVTDPESRNDARHFLERPTFGLIIDSSLPDDFIPPELTGHYGKFRVVSDVIDGRLQITSRESHNRYFNFTFKFMTRCLSLGFIDGQAFKQNCLFYLVLLNDDGSINTRDMHSTLSPRSYEVNGIVKKRKIFCRDKFESKKMYLVTKIHYDMNAMSRVPEMGNLTFKRQFDNIYGQELLDLRQPIVEVQQVSTQIAQTRLTGKKVDKNYTSRPLYFLSDLLEPFCDNPALVFQSFNFPEIIYRLYFARTLLDLNDRFLHETSHRRGEIMKLPQRAPAEDVSSDDGQMSVDSQERYEDDEMDDPDEELEDEDEDYDDEECLSDDTTDSSNDGDERLPPLQRLNAPVREEVDPRRFGEDENEMEVWDVSQYNVPDLKTLKFTDASSPYMNRTLPGWAFASLALKTKPHEDRIIERLERIKSGITSDAAYLGDEEAIKTRTLKIDTSLKPPIEFDRASGALIDTYNLAYLHEAMTLRRSGEKYNLEVLENIGDSYLKYFVSVILYKQLSGDPGLLSSARSRLTSNNCFEHLAKAHELGSYAITRPYQNEALVAILTGQQLSNRLRPKDLADLFESVVGSYLMYCNEYEAILAIEWLGLKLIRDDTFAQLNPHAVTFERAATARLDTDDAAIDEYYESYKARARHIESIIDYKFNDISYLIQAFSHASAPQRCTDSYERLEFLGDAILDYLVVRTLAKLLETSEQSKSDNFRLTPGQLTISKSVLVNNYAFARLAIGKRFDCFIQHSNEDILTELERFNEACQEDDDLDSLDVSDYDKVAKLLADVFEALAGAIYLDSGCSLDTVWRVYYPMMKESIDAEIAKPTRNPVALLHEIFPGGKRITFSRYSPPAEDESLVGIKCIIEGYGDFAGKGYSGKQAKLRAVRKALKAADQEKERVAQSNRDFIAAHRQPAGDNRGRRKWSRQGGRSHHPTMRLDRPRRQVGFPNR